MEEAIVALHVNQLSTLAVVYRERSFTRAAECLAISQPSVSLQIRELERACAMPLVEQRGRVLAFTKLGEDLAHIGERIRIERSKAENLVARHRAGSRGFIAIAASMTTGAYLLPKAIAAFSATYPDVEVQMHPANTAEVADLVLDDITELGIIEGPLEHESLAVSPFAEDMLLCCVGARHRFVRTPSQAWSIADLACETLLLREPGSGTRHVTETTLHELGATFRRSLILGTTEAIKEGVAVGLGIAWISRIAISAETAQGTLATIPIAGVEIARQFSAVRRRDCALSLPGERMLAAIIAAA